MNNNLKPIDQLLDNRKASLAEQVPVLYKEAACKKADIIDRCNDKAGGIDEVEWTYIGPDGRINGIISGPKGRFSIKSIFAGGYDIQCLHVRVLVHKLK